MRVKSCGLLKKINPFIIASNAHGFIFLFYFYYKLNILMLSLFLHSFSPPLFLSFLLSLSPCSGDGSLSAVDIRQRKLEQRSDCSESELLCVSLVKVRRERERERETGREREIVSI